MFKDKERYYEEIGNIEKSPEKERLVSELNPIFSPEELCYLKKEGEELVKAMKELPEDYRNILTLSCIEGYSYPEIAERLGKTEVNVRVTLMRAKEKLREIAKKSPWLKGRYCKKGGKR